MTVTVTGGISNMIGTWKASDSESYVYNISVEEGVTINASGINFLRGGKTGGLDANVYCWDTVEINVDGEMKKVKVVNVKSYDAGKFSHSLSAITFYTPVEGAAYTTGTETVSCQHLGTFKVATAADGSTIYYQD
jgi:hypothetical protein